MTNINKPSQEDINYILSNYGKEGQASAIIGKKIGINAVAVRMIKSQYGKWREYHKLGQYSEGIRETLKPLFKKYYDVTNSQTPEVDKVASPQATSPIHPIPRDL